MTISTNGGNHAPWGASPNAEPISVNECAMVKTVTTIRICRAAAQRNDQAEQEQQMVEPADDVRDADADESCRRAAARSD